MRNLAGERLLIKGRAIWDDIEFWKGVYYGKYQNKHRKSPGLRLSETWRDLLSRAAARCAVRQVTDSTGGMPDLRGGLEAKPSTPVGRQ
jgi:hypothetical protein